MNILPKIEKITRDATITHFFLMFGYKLFSLYFPLFLAAKSFSINQIGYAHFLIYLPIAIFAPIAGFLNHKINPAVLASAGILGYGIYALGMILSPNLPAFYLFQVLLGISAALFFVSSRTALMGSKLENPDRAFAWFYSAPTWADAVAPGVGALIIWKFDFAGVFILSMILQFFNAIFCFTSLKNQTRHLTDSVKIKESSQNYLRVLERVKNKNILPFVSISFLILVLAGFNNAFFVLFLKNLGWTQNQVLLFNSILSFIFLPASFWIIKRVAKFPSEINISRGSQITGIFSVILGVAAGALNFYYVLFIMLGKYIGNLMAGAGRSGIMTTKLKEYPEESAAVDTIFSPLAIASGSIIGGLIIGPLGYPLIFILFGIVLIFAGLVSQKLAKTEIIR